MAAWTAGILLALGLAWLIGAVVVPLWETKAVVGQYRDTSSWVYSGTDLESYRLAIETQAINKLGGPRRAARLLSLYVRMPDRWSTEKRSAMKLLGGCGPDAVPQLEGLLDHRNVVVRSAAAEALKKIRGEEADPGRRGDTETR
jgi:hypothetical protein